jgi:hypothetical protein
LLRLFQRFLRQTACKHLLDLQFAERFPPLSRQDAFALGAAAANQQHFHRQIFGLSLNFALNIMQIFVTGNFDIQPDDRLLRRIPPLLSWAMLAKSPFSTASGWVTGTSRGGRRSGARR